MHVDETMFIHVLSLHTISVYPILYFSFKFHFVIILRSGRKITPS